MVGSSCKFLIFFFLILLILSFQPVFPVYSKDTGTLQINKSVSENLTGIFYFTIVGARGIYKASVTIDAGENNNSVSLDIPPDNYSIREAGGSRFVCIVPGGDNTVSANVTLGSVTQVTFKNAPNSETPWIPETPPGMCCVPGKPPDTGYTWTPRKPPDTGLTWTPRTPPENGEPGGCCGSGSSQQMSYAGPPPPTRKPRSLALPPLLIDPNTLVTAVVELGDTAEAARGGSERGGGKR